MSTNHEDSLLHELLETIRKEEVCLWIGAGFSKYAGYPLAAELKNILHNTLSPADKKLIKGKDSLSDYAEYYTVLKSRIELEALLKQCFTKEPTSTYYHDLLSRVAHFRSIITTNYDQMVETSYTKRAVVIRSAKDIPNFKSHLTSIYKVHGDVTNGGSMVITSKDYSEMYNRLPKDPFWGKIVGEMGSKHIIFLGYGYDDLNLSADFDAVYKHIGGHGRKRYMIAPYLDELKGRQLLEQGIKHLKMDGETFVTALIENLKQHIVKDMENGDVPSQVAIDFMKAFDMKVNIDFDEESARLVALKKVSGPTHQQLKFSTKNQAVVKGYQSLVAGEGGIRLDIMQDQLLEFSHLVEGFQISDIDKLSKFSLELQPSITNTCRLEFPGEKYSMKGIDYKVYVHQNNRLRIICFINGFKVEVSGDFSQFPAIDVKMTMTEPESFSSVKAYFEAYRTFHLLTKGEPVNIYLNGHVKPLKQKMQQVNMADDLEFFYDIYRSLLLIEQTFEIKFSNAGPNNISDEAIKTINIIISLIEKGYHAADAPDGLKIRINKDLTKAFPDPIPEDQIFMLDGTDQAFELLGESLPVGKQQILLPNPVSVEEIDKNKLYCVKNKDKIIVYKFEKFGLYHPDPTHLIYEGKKRKKSVSKRIIGEN